MQRLQSARPGAGRRMESWSGSRVFRYNRAVKRRHGHPGPDASGRRGWIVRKYALGHEPGDDLSASTTAEERLAMMWPLAVEAWALSGAGIPDYDRRAAPVRKFRRGPG